MVSGGIFQQMEENKPRVKIHEWNSGVVPKNRKISGRNQGRRRLIDKRTRRKYILSPLTGHELDAWIVYWGLSAPKAAELLGLSEEALAEYRHRDRVLPKKVMVALREIWFEDPWNIQRRYHCKRIRFEVETTRAKIPEYSGLDLKELMIWRYPDGACLIKHRLTKACCLAYDGPNFQRNRELALIRMGKIEREKEVCRRSREEAEAEQEASVVRPCPLCGGDIKASA